MQITFIGAGSAFNKADGQTNLILTADSGKRMLIDCGNYCPQALRDMGVREKDYATYFDALYISHQHADHIGGLEELAFCTFFNPHKPKSLDLYCVDQLISGLWANSLSGGLDSIEGRLMHLTDYFTCHPLNVNAGFTWENIRCQTVQTVHVMGGFRIVPSYGLLLQEEAGPTIFLTTDTQFCPHQISKFYDQADLIFHDCETAMFRSGVHAHYDDLCSLPEAVRRKMWLCHYQEGPTQQPITDGFAGFVAKGQTFDF